VKDSEIIRDEINRTTRRIEETLDALGERTREAGRTAATWGLVAAAAAAAIAGIVGVYVWRRRRNAIARPRPDAAKLHAVPAGREESGQAWRPTPRERRS